MLKSMHAGAGAQPEGLCHAQDKIATFWEIGKREAEDRRAELRNKDREMEELEERHQVEIKARTPLRCERGAGRRAGGKAGRTGCLSACLHRVACQEGVSCRWLAARGSSEHGCTSPCDCDSCSYTWSRAALAQVYKQKVKHLLYEHQHAHAVLKADGEVAVKQAGDEAAAREADLRRDLHTLHCQLREQVRLQFLSVYPSSCRCAACMFEQEMSLPPWRRVQHTLHGQLRDQAPSAWCLKQSCK